MRLGTSSSLAHSTPEEFIDERDRSGYAIIPEHLSSDDEYVKYLAVLKNGLKYNNH